VVDVSDDASQLSPAEDFAVSFPANARLSSIEFVDGAVVLQFEDGGPPQSVPVKSLAAIHGGSIRTEAQHPAPLDSPSMMDKMFGREGVAVTENVQYVVGLRAVGVGEVLYLVADTFNFRKSLGDDAGLVLEQNLKALIAKLTTVAPSAVQDSFVTALLGGMQLPPPMDSLMEFLRSASR